MNDTQEERLIKALESIACSLATPTRKPLDLEVTDDTPGETLDLSDWHIKPTPPPNQTHSDINIPVGRGSRTRYTP